MGPYYYQLMDGDNCPRLIWRLKDEPTVALMVWLDPSMHVFVSETEIIPFRILAGGVLYTVGGKQ